MALNQVNTQTITKSYTSYSGADIVATFTPPGGKPVVVGELQGITYSVTREKAPVYTMGFADPRAFSRGKRGIAGSLVFTVFDRDALIYAMQEEDNPASTVNSVDGNIGYPQVDKWGDNFEIFEDGTVRQVVRNALYTDEIPPFDITINFVNEYGQSSVMRILAVEILNEGVGMSVDDITTDKACTFVARGLEYIQPVGAHQ
jgi:hypothetical protein